MSVSRLLKSITGSESRPLKLFHSDHYLRHNQRRQEHLATLGLDLSNRRVLELGAGIGDHTSFFLDRGCSVVVSDARRDNIQVLRKRFAAESRADVRLIDVDQANITGLRDDELFDTVYCYGLLYHVGRPSQALDYIATHCSGILLLELCVSFGTHEEVHVVAEAQSNPSQAWSGSGCRPTRPWVMARLRERFEHAYVTRTQPWHEEFPIDWSPTAEEAWPANRLSRAVFIASRKPLALAGLANELLMVQTR
jgi:SAM-dependent methyltransferase